MARLTPTELLNEQAQRIHEQDAEIERLTRERDALRAALADMIDFGVNVSPYALSSNSKQRIANARALLVVEQSTRRG